MNLDGIKSLVRSDLEAVDRLIDRQLETEISLTKELCYHLIHSGGKRIRPLLVLLSTRACGYEGESHIDLAAVIEFIHTATLLHDDVVDASKLRRGSETANEIWGNKASVLVGDFLLSRSLQMMVAVENFEVVHVLASITNAIATGEVMQLMQRNKPDTRQERYMEIITGKTAKLFEAATRLGPVLTHSSENIKQALALYGLHLGIAFQLVDDAMDYNCSAEEMGKNMGDDLAAGSPTLPLIYALQHSNVEIKKHIHDAISYGEMQNIDLIRKAIDDTRAIDYTLDVAKAEIDKAISSLVDIPDSVYKNAMIEIANFVVNRTY